MTHSSASSPPQHGRFGYLALGALGVVFGDIGASPADRQFGIPPNQALEIGAQIDL